MKLGWIISIAAVLAILVALVVAMIIQPDPPTDATAAEHLVKVKLPDDLPPMFTPRSPAANASAIYRDVIGQYNSRRNMFEQGQDTTSQVESIADLLIKAMYAGIVEQGFLDSFIPVRVGEQPSFGDALEAIAGLSLDEAAARYDRDEQDDAVTLTLAVWALGQRAFTHNTRLYPRYTGLRLMHSAGQQLYAWSDDDAIDHELLLRWAEALDAVQLAWQEKVKLVMSVDPHIGDLLNIAQHDEDKTFRVAATLRLGIIKYAPGHRGNSRAIQRAIDEAMADDDPMIARAGEAADDLTREQMRRLH